MRPDLASISYPPEPDLLVRATCTDGVQNQDETDVDCGGATCPGCGDGQQCGDIDGYCKSSRCQSGLCVSCQDGVKNQDEVDTDCGGKTCPACGLGKQCARTNDCAARGCVNGHCVEPLALAFADPAVIAVAAGGAFRALVTGDMNGDGKADLAALDPTGGQVFVLLGAGNGRFSDPLAITVGKSGESLAAGDLNEDGADDLLVPTNDSNCTVVLSDGKGGFLDPTGHLNSLAATAVAAGDVDGDRHMDAILGADRDERVSVLRGNGKGGFRSEVLSNKVVLGMRASAVSDLNGDGRADVVVKPNGDTAAILLSSAGAMLQSAFTFTARFMFTSYSIEDVAIGDFNQDGRPDAAVFYNVRGLFILNDGAGKFHAGTEFAACMYPEAVAAADIDRDGVPDLVLSCDGRISVARGDGAGGLVAGRVQAASFQHGAYSLVTADFNRDGKTDIATTVYPSNIAVVLNTSK